MTFALDAALTLERTGEGRYRAPVSTDYWNFDSAFGGWALALALVAVRAEPDARGDLVSVNAVFPAAIKEGDVDIYVEKISARSRTDFWRVTMRASDAPTTPLFSADIVTSIRKSSDVAFNETAPQAPAPETVDVMPTEIGPRWLKRFEQRQFEGAPFQDNARPRSMTWIRSVDGRPLDAPGLLAVADTPMPRVFFVSKQLRMGSTVSFSLHLMASEAQVASVGDRPLLVETDSDAIRDGAYDQRARLWSPDGALLAVANQIAFFR
ncbi:MAG: thioesterase family protein [Pseudomonadota bacterium]